MDYLKKHSSLFVHVLGLFLLLFVLTAAPVYLYFQLVIYPKSLADIKQNCIDDLKRSSQQLRELFEMETEQAKRWTSQSPPLKHWLLIKKYNWDIKNWVTSESAQNLPLLNLYKITPESLNSRVDELIAPHPQSKNIQVYEIKLEKSHLLSILVSNQNQLYSVVLPVSSILPSVEYSPSCKKNILKSDGNFLFSNSHTQTLETLLIELQSQTSLDAGTIREVRLADGKEFVIKNLLNNIFLTSEVDYSYMSAVKYFWRFTKIHFLVIYVFLIWGAILLTRTLYLRQNTIHQSISEMSGGIFKAFTPTSNDPVFGVIQTEIAAFSNQHLNKMRTFSKHIKMNHLKDKSYFNSINDQNFKMINTVVMQIDLSNLESVFYDYKFHRDLGELNSLWANICEILKNSEAIIDNLSGGSIRVFWIDNKSLAEIATEAAKLVFEIQDLVNSINKHRFIHNSSPYKLNIALHVGELILALIGPLERKEFTGIGPALTVINYMLHVAKVQQSPTIVSQEIFELLNKTYFFTVLNIEDELKKFYSIHSNME